MTLLQKSLLAVCGVIALTVVVLTSRQIMIASTPENYRAFYNGNIVTMKDNDDTYSAMLVKGNKILAVGDNKTILDMLPAGYPANDINGKVLLPGFIKLGKPFPSESKNADFSQIVEHLTTAENTNFENGFTTASNLDSVGEMTDNLILAREHGLFSSRLLVSRKMQHDELLGISLLSNKNDEQVFVVDEFNDQRNVSVSSKDLVGFFKDKTINAAKRFSVDQKLGSLEKGKLADFVILATNKLQNKKHTISETWLGGVKVYTNK